VYIAQLIRYARSCFAYENCSKQGKLLTKKLMLQGYNKSSFYKFFVAVMTLFEITNHYWPICGLICFILFVRLSFPYRLWQRVIPYTSFRLRAHAGCDRSVGDAYSSMAPDLTFFCRGSVLPYARLCICFLDYNYV
jgi:hypothetical protein